jgi:DNA/RNA-binding domain of Phe-tRNA-synthetase-like protein
MNFQHHGDIWKRFPQLSACAVWAGGIHPNDQAQVALEPLHQRARERLNQAGGSEGQLPSIQAWRRAFSELGLKPTQYRNAAESLLRRLRQDGELPRIDPLVNALNALSAAYAIPIAVFDLSQVHGGMEVRLATGTEHFTSFSGEDETPEPGEVVFVDDAGHAHARRWCHRQSARSAVRTSTNEVLIVAEALHVNAEHEIGELLGHIVNELTRGFDAVTTQAVLTADTPRFSFGPP